MKFFIDTANIDEIKKAWELGVIDGVTTNPSLIAKEGKDPVQILKAICSIVKGPVNGEVVGITNMKITSGEGLGFAIPVEAVRFFLDHRDAYAYSTDNPSNPYRYLEPPSKLKRTLTP